MILEQGKKYKAYFVELDDEDRERVIECQVSQLELNIENDYSDIITNTSTISTYFNEQTATVTLKVIPNAGKLFTLVNFMEEE